MIHDKHSYQSTQVQFFISLYVEDIEMTYIYNNYKWSMNKIHANIVKIDVFHTLFSN